jgi:hypothetical protein
MPTTARRRKAQRTAAPSPSPVKPMRFDSVNDPCTGTNEEHVKSLLEELPWMRGGAFVLNMNDRELRPRSTPVGQRTRTTGSIWCKPSRIRDRYQAGISLCNTASGRILHVLERIQAEAAE